MDGRLKNLKTIDNISFPEVLNDKYNISGFDGVDYSSFDYKSESSLGILNTIKSFAADYGTRTTSIGLDNLGLDELSELYVTNQSDTLEIAPRFVFPESIYNDTDKKYPEYVDVRNLDVRIPDTYRPIDLDVLTWSSNTPSVTTEDVIVFTPRGELVNIISRTLDIRLVTLELKINEQEHKRLHRKYYNNCAVSILIS